MDKHIYLLRHGRPQFGKEGSYCIGRRSDLPLSEEGERQARLLASCFPSLRRIYCSPLLRARQTACIVGGRDCELLDVPDITELDVGAWDGLSFAEIRRQFAPLYAARGRDWSLTMPGGEPLSAAARRMQAAVVRLAAAEEGDPVAVTHDGAIRALLWRLLQIDPHSDAMPRTPYGSVTVLRYDGGMLSVTARGRLPGDVPSDAEIAELWDACGTPPRVRAHCQAVCRECMRLCGGLENSGCALSREALRAAALLHDLCRSQGAGHAQAAAELLQQRGYLRIAQIVQLHMDGSDGPLDEAQLLFYADKLYRGEDRVEIEQRFAHSEAKCMTGEARRMHALRKRRARDIEAALDNAHCRSERP